MQSSYLAPPAGLTASTMQLRLQGAMPLSMVNVSQKSDQSYHGGIALGAFGYMTQKHNAATASRRDVLCRN